MSKTVAMILLLATGLVCGDLAGRTIGSPWSGSANMSASAPRCCTHKCCAGGCCAATCCGVACAAAPGATCCTGKCTIPTPCSTNADKVACTAAHCVWTAAGKCVNPPTPPPPPPPGPKPGPKPPPAPAGWVDACAPGTNGAALKFCDTALSMDARLDDLVPRVAVDETAGQLTARESPVLESLGIPAYYWGTNAIHGVEDVDCLTATGGCPTSFPAPCTMAASFNMTLVRDMGKVIGRELRAYYNARVHNSLDTWSPTININRDPRWGRNVESPGEDPLLNGLYGTAYTQGLQQFTGTEKLVQAVVTLKHWLAYSIEGSQLARGTGRHNIDVAVSAYDLAHTYLPPFELAVKQGKALGVMCSYNAVNGLPTCGNPALNRTLREDWGFGGYVTSDTDACGDIVTGHPKGIDHFPPRPTNGTDATKLCLMGGTDIDSGGTYLTYLAKVRQLRRYYFGTISLVGFARVPCTGLLNLVPMLRIDACNPML